MADVSWLRWEAEMTDDVALALARLDVAADELRAADADLAALDGPSWSSPAVGRWLAARAAFQDAHEAVSAWLGVAADG